MPETAREGGGNGLAIVLRDIQDHAVKGNLSLFDLGVFAVIRFQAEFSSGVWFGSAARVHATAPEGASLRDVQRSMGHLEDLRLLRSFRKHGQRGNAPYLVHNYEPLSGALRGKRLNAFASDDWRNRVYEPCALPDTEPVASVSPAGQVEQKTGETAFDLFWDKWPRKQLKGPARRAWEKIPARLYPAVMAGLERWLASEQWARGIIPYAASWLTQRGWEDEAQQILSDAERSVGAR